MLKELAKHHDKWIRSVKSSGEYDFAEDIVQEMYLKVNKYCDESKVLKDGEVQMGYIYFILWNLTKDFYKEKQKVDKFSIGEGFDLIDERDEDNEHYNIFLNKLDNEIDTWKEFDRKVFRLSVGTYGTQNIETHGEKVSIRKFADGSKISRMTIFKTMKNCKERIENNLYKEWQDYINRNK